MTTCAWQVAPDALLVCVSQGDGMREFHFTPHQPWDREALLTDLRELHEASSTFWEGFSTDEFFTPVGNGWSPAGNVRHLNKSIRPLARALGLSRLMLRI